MTIRSNVLKSVVVLLRHVGSSHTVTTAGAVLAGR
jgi:hypothetical protein